MTRLPFHIRRLPLAGAFIAATALTSAGCGSSVSHDGVAAVGGTVIAKSAFGHWYGVTAAQQAAQSGGAVTPATAPDPPSFSNCIAVLSAQQPSPGTPTPSRSAVKQQCQQQYEQLRDATMRFLITAQWLLSEAARRHIVVSDQQVTTLFLRQKKQAFPRDTDYQRYLQQTGQTQADVNFRIKLQLIQTGIERQVQASAAPVTHAEIARYYARNKRRYAQPESRDLLVIRTSSLSNAQAALAAVRSRKPWADVAKRYSNDSASKAAGGALPGVTRGQQEQVFEAAIFSASPGQIEGPVKTQLGYYVFEVTRVTPASQQSLAQAEPSIAALLKPQHSQAALTTFVRNFQANYTARTDCATQYLVTDVCANAPKSLPVSGSPPTPGKPLTRTPQATTPGTVQPTAPTPTGP